MGIANVNPEILRWAKNRPGVNQQAVTNIHNNYFLWEEGEKKPTFKQAKELARKLRIPFGYLFLSEVPTRSVYTPDLRTIGSTQLVSYSVDLEDVIKDAQNKQNWYSEMLQEAGDDKLAFVGKYSAFSESLEVANDIITTCKLSIAERKSSTDYLKFFAQKLEEAGIIVLRNGKVGFNTHRVLDVEEFRGFALNDPYAPLIFVNSTDYKSAQLFTLIHEAAHIWIGEEGVSKSSFLQFRFPNKIERVCNQIAAEVLVPREHFVTEWEKTMGTLEQRCDTLRRMYQVSTIVLAYRAREFNLVRDEEFQEYYTKLKTIWDRELKKRKEKPGGDFNNSFPVANSPTLTNAVFHAIQTRQMLLRNGARLLSTKPSTLVRYINEQGGML